MTNVAFDNLDFKEGVEKPISLSGSTVVTTSGIDIVDVELPLTKVEEYFGSNGEYRVLVGTSSDEGLALVQRVEDVFGINIANALRIKMLGIENNDNVISSALPKSVYKELEGDFPLGYCFSGIKFFMNNETVAIKVYRLMETLTHNYPELPEGSEIIWWANYHDFTGYDYEQEFDNYLDMYFLNDDHQVVCDYYGKDLPSDLYTGYGIRFNKNTLDIKKVKSYTYEENPSVDWKKVMEKAKLDSHNVTLN